MVAVVSPAGHPGEMDRRKSTSDEDNEMAEASNAPKFRPFKSNIKSKNLAPPAAAFAKADEDEDEDDYMSNDILKEM